MPFIFVGRLCGHICDECEDPLANVSVRLYRLREEQDATSLAAARVKETFASQDAEAVAAKAGSLLAEGRTGEDGSFRIALPEGYEGGAFELDVRFTGPMHGGPDGREPLQFTLTTVQPRFREVGDDRVAAFEYCLPARSYCLILAWFGMYAICGRVTHCESKRPIGGVRVSAFDVDWLQDDALGDDTTDANGHFLIFYPAAAFLKTPISWLQFECVHGPDVYFHVDFVPTATALLVEPRSRGRQPDRENVGPCLCVDLCIATMPPVPPDPPSVFQRVGSYNFLTAIHSATGQSGRTIAGDRAFYSTIRLNGALAKQLNGHPVEYAFFVTEVDAAGAAISTRDKVSPAQIARTRIGALSVYAPAFPGDPNPIKVYDYTVNGGGPGLPERVATFTADGWVRVPQESDVWSGGFFTPSGDMIELITESLATWNGIDQTGKLAGGTSGSTFAHNRHFRIELRVREAGVPGSEISGGLLDNLAIENTLYNNVEYHPSWNGSVHSKLLGVGKLDIQQLLGIGMGCTEIETDLDVLVTAAHPNLGPVTISLTGPTGTKYFTPPAATADERAGAATIPAPPSPDAWDVASLPPCAYVVQLSATLLLTTGDHEPSPLTDLMAFCKA